MRRLSMKLSQCELCRSGVLAVLSHELRNPLAALSNSLYVLQRSQPSEERSARAMEVMDRQIQHLVTLVDGLTDAVRLEQGKIELQMTEVDLSALLRRAAKQYEPLFSEGEIKFSVQIPFRTISVSADPTRLLQIVGHLLQNAARFSSPGGWVVLSLETDEFSRLAHIRVQDSGVGLDGSLLKRLFEPFFQADQTLSRSRGGLGLGLTLVRGFVELHGGSVRAESDGLGRGSTFIVDLPIWNG
jgi:signal transduction histidine kinase